MKRFRVKNYGGEQDFDPTKHYKFRVEYQSKKLKSLLESGKINKERVTHVLLQEEQNYKANMQELVVREKLNKDVAVIIPTYWAHKPWLRSCLESCGGLGFYILLAYDNHFWVKQTASGLFPPPKVMTLADSVGMKHRSYFNSVGISHMWNMWYNLKLLKGFGFPYILSIAGDCILERPEGFPELWDLLGDNDIICNIWDEERKYAGTLGVLSKTDVYLGYFEHFVRNQYDHSGSTEGRLFKYLRDGNFKVAPVKNSAHNFKMPDPNSDWNRTIGYRHLHAEQVIRQEERLYPVEKKYFDFGDECENIKKDGPLHKYYLTEDMSHLEKWWGWGRE